MGLLFGEAEFLAENRVVVAVIAGEGRAAIGPDGKRPDLKLCRADAAVELHQGDLIQQPVRIMPPILPGLAALLHQLLRCSLDALAPVDGGHAPGKIDAADVRLVAVMGQGGVTQRLLIAWPSASGVL